MASYPISSWQIGGGKVDKLVFLVERKGSLLWNVLVYKQVKYSHVDNSIDFSENLGT